MSVTKKKRHDYWFMWHQATFSECYGVSFDHGINITLMSATFLSGFWIETGENMMRNLPGYKWKISRNRNWSRKTVKFKFQLHRDFWEIEDPDSATLSLNFSRQISHRWHGNFHSKLPITACHVIKGVLFTSSHMHQDQSEIDEIFCHERHCRRHIKCLRTVGLMFVWTTTAFEMFRGFFAAFAQTLLSFHDIKFIEFMQFRHWDILVYCALHL